jgi:uncharacterized protein YjiS (DUF1127 family)
MSIMPGITPVNSTSSMFSVSCYKVVVWFENLGQKLAERRTRRETFKTLHSLTDRELADIGISRGDIRSISNDTWTDNRKRDELPYVRTYANPNLEGSV